jgi:hypothetical protein
MRVVVLAITIVLALPFAGAAQSPAASSAPAPASKAGQPPAAAPAGSPPAQAPTQQSGAAAGLPAPSTALQPQGYTYDPAGRRDPFVSLVRRGAEAPGTATGTRPPGLSGLSVSEVSLRGTLRGRDGNWIGMLQGVDNKTYLVRAGDKLLDGTVRSISADGMIILQRVNDPLSLETQREVRKVLRQTEEAK